MGSEMFDYGIMTNGKCIAVFLHEGDRDCAMSKFEDFYSDCEFESVDDLHESVTTEKDGPDYIVHMYDDDNKDA